MSVGRKAVTAAVGLASAAAAVLFLAGRVEDNPSLEYVLPTREDLA